MKKVYFIPGLGADKRSFGFLNLPFCEPQFIEWLKPALTDTLPLYAEKLFRLINDEEATIVGLSFGGMLATEMAKQHPQTKVIIISSAKSYRELPVYFRFWKRFPVYKYFSDRTMKSSGKMIIKILGAKGKEQQKLQHEIIASSDPSFTRWAMDAIVKWSNNDIPKNVIHIHGTTDRLLPYRSVKADYPIAKGEHLMVMDRADEISELLKTLCTT